LFANDFVSNVVGMRNASAVAHPIAPPAERPRLVVVPEMAPPTPAPVRQRFAALLAGLICGFVLAALAAVVGGGNPRASLGIAATLGVALIAVLVHARRVTVRNRRRARTRRTRHQGGTVVSLDAARAA
jgi:hypothetical protein